MLFNSLSFIFLFLPASLVLYYAIAASPLRVLRRPLMVAMTLVFYALGDARMIWLLLASIACNYTISRMIVGSTAEKAAGRWLVLGVVLNVATLAYFKYFSFLASNIEAVTGAAFHIGKIALPLAISFYTFQQIAYLVDVKRGRAKVGTPWDYVSFVLFFPQLLAGPITQYEEVKPQLAQRPDTALATRNILIGLVMFAIGLAKKTMLADTLVLYAEPVYTAARNGEAIGALNAWIGALSYTGQIYFDFSGYSDMAIGVARMFGIVLPLNFFSPLRATSVVELWRRWHVTLGRWVQSYIFQPIAIQTARYGGRRGMGNWGMLLFSSALPTIIAMVVLGIWHGAGWTFVVFGLMHGIYMSVNELWAAFRRKARKKRKAQGLTAPWWHAPLARFAVLVAVVVAKVAFGSATLAGAVHLWEAMAGTHGLLLPMADWPLGLTGAVVTVIAMLLVAYLAPNSHEIMGRIEPVLEWKRWKTMDKPSFTFEWRMTPGWQIVAGTLFFLALAFMSRGTAKFIYMAF